MDLGSILIVLALAIVVIAFLAKPLLDHQGRDPTPGERRLSVLLASREQVLETLLEMDADHAMGKILPEDYQAERARWVARGVEILKEIDAQSAVAPSMPPALRDLDQEIEAEVARLRRGRPASFCSQCGLALQPGDRFCPRCGAAVARQEVRA
jgi:hypothetical protein